MITDSPTPIPVSSTLYSLRKPPMVVSIIGAVILSLISGVSGYYLGLNNSRSSQKSLSVVSTLTPSPSIEISPSPTSVSDFNNSDNSGTIVAPGNSVVIPADWKEQNLTVLANNNQTLNFALKLPSDYKLLYNNADVMIQQQYPAGQVVTSADPPTDDLTLRESLLFEYDGGSRRDFYLRYLNGELDFYKPGSKANIISIEELPLINGSYIKLVQGFDGSDAKVVHYITVNDGIFIAFDANERNDSFLQDNIAAILSSLMISR